MSEATVGVKQETKPIVARGAFHDSFADAHASAVGKKPVHSEDVVAEGAEAARARGVVTCSEVIEQGGVLVQLKRKPEPCVWRQAGNLIERQWKR